MTSIKITPRYEDHLWYPILIKNGGYNHIKEMQGKEINAWNDMVNKIRVYGWVWKNKRHEDECHYVPCYTPGNHIERGEMLALVDPKDLPDYYTEW